MITNKSKYWGIIVGGLGFYFLIMILLPSTVLQTINALIAGWAMGGWIGSYARSVSNNG